MTSDKRMTIMMTRRRTLMLGERQRKDEDGVLSHGVRLCAYSMEEICVWFCLVVFWKHSPHWRTRTNTFMQFKYALAEEECASTRLLWCRTSTATTAQETPLIPMVWWRKNGWCAMPKTWELHSHLATWQKGYFLQCWLYQIARGPPQSKQITQMRMWWLCSNLRHRKWREDTYRKEAHRLTNYKHTVWFASTCMCAFYLLQCIAMMQSDTQKRRIW